MTGWVQHFYWLWLLLWLSGGSLAAPIGGP